MLLISALKVFNCEAQQWDAINFNCGGLFYSLSPDTVNTKLYAAGAFTCDTTGLNQFFNIAVYNPLNNSWDKVGGATYEFDCGIWCKSILYESGDVYLGGNFQPMCSSPTSPGHIAKYNGLQWEHLAGGFTNPIFSPGSIDAIVKYNNQIFAGGSLRNFYLGNDTCNAIGYWDGTQWNTLGTGGSFNLGVQNTQATNYFGVTAMIVFNNLLFVSGIFDRVGNLYTSNGVATWNGINWDSTGINAYTGIDCFGIYDNELYAGGEGDLIKYDANGAWQSFAHPTSSVYPVGVISGIVKYKNDLVVTGLFDTIDGVAANGIARWDGQQWHPFGTGLRYYDNATGQYTIGRGLTMAVLDECLYVSGGFNNAGPAYTYSGIARWCEPTSFNELIGTATINVLPNPAKDILNVSVKGTEIATELKFFLHDITGKEIMQTTFKKTTALNIKDMAKGIYVYKAFSKHGFISAGKIVKE